MNFIKRENNIYIEDENNKIIAKIEFEDIGNGIYNIYHTFVDESLRGQNIASKLVEEAVKYIKSKGYKVQATCSYANAWLQKHEKEDI